MTCPQVITKLELEEINNILVTLKEKDKHKYNELIKNEK